MKIWAISKENGYEREIGLEPTLLHIGAQGCVGRKLRGLRSAGRAFGMPLRRRRPILQSAATRGGVAAQLAGDRRRRSPELTRDRPYRAALDPHECDILSLG